MKLHREFFGLIVLCVAGQAYEYGPDPRYTGAPGDNKTACIDSGCHQGTVNSNTSGSVKILLPGGATTYVPGQAMTIQVQITDSSKKAYGFQLTARLASNLSQGQAGDFATGTDGYTQVLCDNGAIRDSGTGQRTTCPSQFPVEFIEHTLSGYESSISTKGSYAYTFTWTPPASGAGTVTLYAAGNAGVGDPPAKTPTDVYTTNVTLTPTASTTATTTTLTSSATTSPFGQNFTLTAVVSPSSASGTVTFNDGTTSLGTATLSGGTATLTVSQCLAAAIHSITAAYGGDSNDAASTSSALQETINQPTTAPVLKFSGVVPLYSTSNNISAGSWISLYGCNLYVGPTSPGYALWSGNFPTTLGNTSVNIDSKPGFLWYVSPTQVNVQVPNDSSLGQISVNLTNTNGTSNSVNATLASVAPSFLLLDTTHMLGEIPTPNGNGAYANGAYDLLAPPGSSFGRPARPGETVELYGVGFGPTQSPAPAGQSLSTVSVITSPISCTVGGVSTSAAAAIIFAGEYQINVGIPQSLAVGDQTVACTVGGVQTPPGTVVSVQ